MISDIQHYGIIRVETKTKRGEERDKKIKCMIPQDELTKALSGDSTLEPILNSNLDENWKLKF